MNNDNPFFMNFNVSEFMSQFAIPNMDSEYSKKLVDAHEKNLDSFVSANKVVSEGYRTIASKQMEIFQHSLGKMVNYSPEQSTETVQQAFLEGSQQMQELIEMATNVHREAFDILSNRAKDLIDESKLQ
ncbi:MAG: phasin family protein [Pseudomonadota bacterium]